MKYLYLATAVFCLTMSAAATIAANVHPEWVQLEAVAAGSLVVGLACVGLYQLECIKEEHACLMFNLEIK